LKVIIVDMRKVRVYYGKKHLSQRISGVKRLRKWIMTKTTSTTFHLNNEETKAN